YRRLLQQSRDVNRCAGEEVARADGARADQAAEVEVDGGGHQVELPVAVDVAQGDRGRQGRVGADVEADAEVAVAVVEVEPVVLAEVAGDQVGEAVAVDVADGYGPRRVAVGQVQGEHQRRPVVGLEPAGPARLGDLLLGGAAVERVGR